MVEIFLVRRLLIGRATAHINRVLLDVVTEMDPDLPVKPRDAAGVRGGADG